MVPLDAPQYSPRDVGPEPHEPCRDSVRRLRFEAATGEGSPAALSGHGDRLALLELHRDTGTLQARLFDVEAGREVGLSEPVRRAAAGDGSAGDEVIVHESGVDLVSWGAAEVVVGRLDRDGTLLSVDVHARAGGERSIVRRAALRTAEHGLLLLTSGDGIVLHVVGGDGSVRGVRVLPSRVEDMVQGSIAAAGDRVVGALVLGEASRDVPRFVRFDLDIAAGDVTTTDVWPELPVDRYRTDAATAVYVDELDAVAAFAISDQIGAPSGVEIVWWEPGGAELAQAALSRLSIEGLGILGLSGRMPQQTLALYTGAGWASSSLLVGRVRAPGVVEGAASPLAADVGLRSGVTWQWRDGATAIAYASAGTLEVLLACEGTP
ncbi:MAG: hypothetical protein M5U28_37600 [Sandaracinaceae bacterium]|nr:hypothetical protein [Sandaracinaceae bacterium]